MDETRRRNVLSNIPSVSDLLERPPLRNLVNTLSHNVVVSGVRVVLDELRQDLHKSTTEARLPDVGELAERIARRILREEIPALRPVINATGVLLHTGLGRAPLAEEAAQELVSVAADYVNLETDLTTGQRSRRVETLEPLLRELTGADAALVVNNNAGATLLTLAALAADREVIVSRGQLIEIGGSYRLPDVMRMSGARLREVGTTNKTRVNDYRQAIEAETAALLRVHTSNYRVVGFTESVPLPDLVRLGREHQLPVIDDIGSGALIDMAPYGCQDEPVASESVAAGADVVLFSGDKLLGGPQCGIVVGRKDLLQRIEGHPMMRALRVGKLTLAALGATLRLYRDPRQAAIAIPLLNMLSTSVENLRDRATRLAPQMERCRAIAQAVSREETTFLGGGSVPTQEIETYCIALSPADGSADRLATRLRQGKFPVVGRIQKDAVLLDLRSVPPRLDTALVEAILALDVHESETQED